MTSIEEKVLETTFQVSPNPVSGVAHLRITNTEHRITNLEVFTISGMKIKELLNEELPTGVHDINTDMSDLPAGMYYCVLRTGNEMQTIKLVKL